MTRSVINAIMGSLKRPIFAGSSLRRVHAEDMSLHKPQSSFLLSLGTGRRLFPCNYEHERRSLVGFLPRRVVVARLSDVPVTRP